MDSFESIFERAASRKGGADELEALLPDQPSKAKLEKTADAAVLAEMTKCVFRSGFVWQIIEAKWPGFETAFNQFDVVSCAMLSDEDLEKLQQNTDIVRNGKKIAAVRDNAKYVLSLRDEYGSFGKFLSDWPDDDFVELWAHLKRTATASADRPVASSCASSAATRRCSPAMSSKRSSASASSTKSRRVRKRSVKRRKLSTPGAMKAAERTARFPASLPARYLERSQPKRCP